MKKTISEELPERKHPPASGEMRDDRDEKRGKDPKDRVRQAVYDIRYRARREEIPLTQAFSQYMQNSSMSQQEKVLVKQKLLGKPGMKAEDFNIQDFASNNVANALYKVFVENYKNEEPITLTYMEKLETTEDRKYKVRVIGKDGRSYVRYATREKINSLRANPNIESVEMTEYGEPYEGERKRGEATAAVKSGKDWDGDGKVETGAKEYRGVVHNAIQRKKGGVPDGKDTSNVREDFIGEKKRVDNTTDESQKPLDVMKGSNNVTINPNVPGTEKNNVPGLQMAHHELDGPFIVENGVSKAQQKFFGMLREMSVSKKQQNLFGLALSVKRGETPRSDVSDEVLKIVDTMSEKKIRDFAKTKHEGLPVHKEETECEKGDSKERDTRGDYAKINLDKNRLRLGLGVKNPIVMVGEEKFGPVGQPDRNRRHRILGGGTQEDIEAQKRRENRAGERARAQLARNLAREAEKARREKYRPEEVEFEGEMIDELRKSEKLGFGSPEDSPGIQSRAYRREKGPRGARFQYSGSQEFGAGPKERGKKKNVPGSQHQRLNPPEETGRQLERGSEAARQRWHTSRD